jgi:hypothetical protein
MQPDMAALLALNLVRHQDHHFFLRLAWARRARARLISRSAYAFCLPHVSASFAVTPSIVVAIGIFFCKFMPAFAFSFTGICVPTFIQGIQHIILIGSDPKMFQVHTGPIIASMANLHFWQ